MPPLPKRESRKRAGPDKPIVNRTAPFDDIPSKDLLIELCNLFRFFRRDLEMYYTGHTISQGMDNASRHINHITEISRSIVTSLDFHQKESHEAETKKYEAKTGD